MKLEEEEVMKLEEEEVEPEEEEVAMATAVLADKNSAIRLTRTGHNIIDHAVWNGRLVRTSSFLTWPLGSYAFFRTCSFFSCFLLKPWTLFSWLSSNSRASRTSRIASSGSFSICFLKS
jgi:hypothetical protein